MAKDVNKLLKQGKNLEPERVGEAIDRSDILLIVGNASNACAILTFCAR